MYRTCIYCQTDLGSNQALEHLPIGRRIAFDAKRGRLWVVCHRCERWNLTPFDSRWEAIESAERLFRATYLRYSTDNIGLAHLAEGTELIRIGEPLRPELAAWRYGDQFGRRRLRHLVSAGLTTAAVVTGYLSVAYMIGATGVGFGIYQLLSLSYRRRTALRLRKPDGSVLRLSQAQLDEAELHGAPDEGRPALTIPQSQVAYFGIPVDLSRHRFTGDQVPDLVRQILPVVNRRGGSASQVQEAVQLLGGQTSPMDLVWRTVMLSRKIDYKLGTPLADIPPQHRLAMEMALHEGFEREALEGELDRLEQAWREAEELAAIADSLLIPDQVEGQLRKLRGSVIDEG